MIEAVFRVRLPCSWVTTVTRDFGAVVSLVEQKPTADGLLQSLVEIDPGEADPAVLVEALRGNAFVKEVEAIVPKRGKILATLLVRDCHACQVLAESECFLSDAVATREDGVEWTILAPKPEAVRSVARTLEHRGLEVDIVAIRPAKESGELTNRQEQVLSLAYRLGYFEFPKKISLTRLAKKLDVSKSTLSEILRTGEAKILHSFFQGLIKRSR